MEVVSCSSVLHASDCIPKTSYVVEQDIQQRWIFSPLDVLF